MPECPICKKELESYGSNSYSAHVQTKHPLYWAKAKRLRLIATLNLIISLVLTILLAAFFYTPDGLGYAIMGLAALFLAFSAVFSLSERGLAKRSGNKAGEKASEAAKPRRKTDRREDSRR